MASTPHPPAAEPVRTNWAGNYTYQARQVLRPADADALRGLLRTQKHAKAVGTRHSFNSIADTAGAQFDLSALQSMSLDAAAGTVTIGAGVTYGQLAPWLHAQGYALHNLASLPHISVAGACATATHGSGLGNRCLTDAVRALELLTAEGETLAFSRAADAGAFALAAVHLGALGIATSLTLDLLPTFHVAQTVYTGLSFDQLEHNLPAIFGAAYSVSLFTDWQDRRITQAWVKRRCNGTEGTTEPETFYGARRQTSKLHPLPGISAESCTEQLGVPGPWYDRLPHFRLDYTPSAGAELQTEYFVPLDRAYPAILAVKALRDRITPHLLISELRTVAADRFPMSMAYQRDSLAIHFTWKQDPDPVLALLPVLEAALAPFLPRPHWAKLFTLPADRLRAAYPDLDTFHDFAATHDPESRFRNACLDQIFAGDHPDRVNGGAT